MRLRNPTRVARTTLADALMYVRFAVGSAQVLALAGGSKIEEAGRSDV